MLSHRETLDGAERTAVDQVELMREPFVGFREPATSKSFESARIDSTSLGDVATV